MAPGPNDKKFKIKISVYAEHINEDPKIGSKSFDELVNEWFIKQGKLEELTNFLNIDPQTQTSRNVKYFSYLQNFKPGDNVDKEAYD